MLDDDMDILNLLNSEKLLRNQVHSATYYRNKEGIFCFSNAAFSDLQKMHQAGIIDEFWNDSKQDSKALQSGETITYYKVVKDNHSQQPIHFIIQKEPTYTTSNIHAGVMTTITWCEEVNKLQDFSLDQANVFKFFYSYLQELKNYYENIISSMPGNVYWLNRECVLLGGNTNLAQMFGLNSYKDLAGLTYEQMSQLANWNEGQGESFRKNELTVMKTGVPRLNVEELPVIIDGEKKYYISNKVPLKNMTGEVVGVLGISLDITDKKLIEQDLIVAKEKAEAASRAKTEFLANMSHDMKTPLAGIVTTAEALISDKTISAQGREFSQIISSSGKQLADFFTSCLDLSKMEMTEWASQSSTFSIKKLLEDIQALYLPKAISSHLMLEIECDRALPEAVNGHHDSLYRVLLNLVGNAIKFTKQGSVTVRASLLKRLDDKTILVELQVHDTGMGIPEDKHAAIFEKLYRVKPSYESQVEGSGIGLYIVDQYVKRMDGKIRVDSKVGEGSTFTVTIPLQVAMSESLKQTPMSKLNSDVAIPITTQTRTINDAISDNATANLETDHLPKVLLVEDNPMIQFVTKNLLNTAGFAVDLAGSGEEALEMVEPNKYGLIYMDIGLPGMTGYQTAKAIREKEKQLSAAIEVPIIALTGHGAVDVLAFCDDAGMQGILSKPISREQAQVLWKHFTEDATIPVPGLTVLTHSIPEPAPKDILDIEDTIRILGVKDIALNLIGTLTEDLKSQFLPHIKTIIGENKTDELLFLLHRQLGALAYAKAPRLEKKLLELQAMAQKGADIDPSVYQEIEAEVLRIVHCYENMDHRKVA